MDVPLTRAILNEFTRELPDFNLGGPYALDRLFAAFWARRHPGHPLPASGDPFPATEIVLLRDEHAVRAHERIRRAWSELVAADGATAGAAPPTRATGGDLPGLPRDARAIQTFLIRQYPDEPFGGLRLTSRLFRRLYGEYLPEIARRLPGASLPARSRPALVETTSASIEQRWRMFIADLTDDASVLRSPATALREFRSKHLARVPLDVDEVEDDARSIVGFLINRYRQVDIKAAGALTECFAHVRAEFGLPRGTGRLLPQDLRSAFYYANKGASDRTRTEWRAVLRDLAARRSAEKSPR